MEFKQAILKPHIAIIKTEDDLDKFIDRAGVDQRYRAMTCEMFGAIGSLSLTNPHTGEYCLAYEYIGRLMEQSMLPNIKECTIYGVKPVLFLALTMKQHQWQRVTPEHYFKRLPPFIFLSEQQWRHR